MKEDTRRRMRAAGGEERAWSGVGPAAVVPPPYYLPPLHLCAMRICSRGTNLYYLLNKQHAGVQQKLSCPRELNLTSSATNRVLIIKSAPTLISRSMSPLLGSMVLCFCKTIQQHNSADVLGWFFGAAHTPARFGVAHSRATAGIAVFFFGRPLAAEQAQVVRPVHPRRLRRPCPNWRAEQCSTTPPPPAPAAARSDNGDHGGAGAGAGESVPC
jgi:hypothetical protein